MADPIAEGCWLLPDQAIIRIEGPDARAFLHGQFTSAVSTLEPAMARPAAWCTAQGRVLANGPLWPSDHGFEWMVARDLLGPIAQRLRLFVLRAQVSISEPRDSRILAALGAHHVPEALHCLNPWSVMPIRDRLWIVAPMSAASRPAAWCLTSAPGNEPADAGAWAAARLGGGWPCIQAGNSGQFLTGALDMDLNGTIDFQKGCYPGQEVIARSHYRGTVKRRLAYGVLKQGSTTPAEAGARDLYAAGAIDERPIGRVIESAIHAQTLHVAAEIVLSDWPRARYALGRPEGPLVSLQPVHAPAGVQPGTI
jgi:folate-binding protein YgfZ